MVKDKPIFAIVLIFIMFIGLFCLSIYFFNKDPLISVYAFVVSIIHFSVGVSLLQ